ncbi:MAG: thermopsin family protease [Nitrososphaerota archaeon]|nr:thermopsin family protease [Nitrososphaerota archaeon]
MRGHVDIYAGYYSEPAPTGIADYGILNDSGTVTAYTEAATAVTGTAVIDSLQSTIPNPPQGSSPNGAGLQLNVVMQVNTTASSYDYWLQNTVTFYTNNDTFYYVSNVWNYSSPTASMIANDTAGLGSISPSGNQSFYGYATNETGYTLPLALEIPINVSYSGDAVRASFSYLQAQGGASLAGTPSRYDMVTITEPQQVLSAVILVTGKEYTPSQNYFDSELDFGGDANGANATFTAMQAVLNMSYLLTDGRTALPPSVYGFGGDTAEAATNLQTSRVGGEFVVTIGTEDFQTSFVPTSSSTSSTSTAGTSSASSAQAASTSASNTTTYASATSAAGGIPEFPSGGLAVALLAVALAGSYFVVRRRALSAGPPRG